MDACRIISVRKKINKKKIDNIDKNDIQRYSNHNNFVIIVGGSSANPPTLLQRFHNSLPRLGGSEGFGLSIFFNLHTIAKIFLFSL